MRELCQQDYSQHMIVASHILKQIINNDKILLQWQIILGFLRLPNWITQNLVMFLRSGFLIVFCCMECYFLAIIQLVLFSVAKLGIAGRNWDL